MTVLKHARLELMLHTLAEGQGPALLLLHALGGSSADWDVASLQWPGPIHALDLSGHGQSGRVYGGAYAPELWAADADVALQALGTATLVGAGVGGYAALLLAGARPAAVPAVVLLPGAGLDGTGPEPWEGYREVATPTAALQRTRVPSAATDAAVAFGDMGPRPPDYSDAFATRASRVVLMEDDAPRPPWWCSLRALAGVEQRREGLAQVLRELHPQGS